MIGKTEALEIVLRTTSPNSTLGIWARCEAMVASFEHQTKFEANKTKQDA